MLTVYLVLLFFSLSQGAPTDDEIYLPLLRYDKKSYHVVTDQRMNYFQATRYCKNLNMSMLTIESKEENDIAYKIIRDTDVAKEYWSAASRIVDGKSWVWLSNGHPVDYTNWNKGEPNTKTELCIDLRIDHRNELFWYDVICTIERPFICEKSNAKDDAEDQKSLWSRISASSNAVYSNVVNFNKKMYYFASQFRGTFWRANQFCDTIGLKPVAVETKEEYERIYKHIRDTNSALEWWTSGTRILDEYTWWWLSNKRKVDYINWHTHEPNNWAYIERCLKLKVIKDQGTFMDDFNCKVEYPVICEMALEDKLQRNKREVVKPDENEVEDEDDEDCEQPVVSIYINNIAKAKKGRESSEIKVIDKSTSDKKSIFVKNGWSC